MKARTKKTKAEVPFDPVLFAAAVPGRKPTARDLADAKEHQDDSVEPQQYDSMEDLVRTGIRFRRPPPTNLLK
jgi:hypothetical protein